MRATLDALADEASGECAKFSEDVKFWAEFQTGVKVEQINFIVVTIIIVTITIVTIIIVIITIVIIIIVLSNLFIYQASGV